jgi:hypothetical protein
MQCKSICSARAVLFVAVLLLSHWVSTAFADDTLRLRTLFDKADEHSTVIIPPGDYHLDGKIPIALKSSLNVTAYGARFCLPESLEEQSRAVLFSGQNIRNLRWQGGHFEGHVFDPDASNNAWPPNANTRAIVISTSTGGETNNITFRDVSSSNLAGSAITVLGAAVEGSDRQTATFARNVTIQNCNLERTGKFMWDYGYLWQIMVWPEEFDDTHKAMAEKYFRKDLVRTNLKMLKNDDRVFFNNADPLPISQPRIGLESERGYDTVCFYGTELPSVVTKGRQYFVVDSQPDFIRVSESIGGPPIRFTANAGSDANLITNLFQAHLALYAPKGSGPGKGAIDLVGCKDVIVQGCRFSALGDTMHIQKCDGVVFSGNHIIGSRMGAFFLAEFCRNASITGNTVDGTNGSRVISVEKSCEDVVISGNTFRGGGRGSWINQPRNFVLSNNIFIDNTTKCQPDPKLGRRTFLTGDYEQYPELYFTTYEPNGTYANVIVEGNLFVSGPNASHAMTFAPGGDGIQVVHNTFAGPVRTIPEPTGCSHVSIRDNHGAQSVEERWRQTQVNSVTRIPGLVAFWDFVEREPDGERRFIAHVPPESATNYPLDAANYVRDYWGEGRAATYEDFPLLGRGPFGSAIRIVKEADPTFRPFLHVPRTRLHDTPLDIKGAGKSVTVVVWAIRESGNHALAGIWHEGTDLKQNETAVISKVERGQRQFALFAGLNKAGSACGHVSENGASSFLNKYALHKCNSLGQSPEIPADSPASLLDTSWQTFAMTFDHDKDEITGWLNGVSGDRWLDHPKKDQLISFAYNAYMQGYFARLPGKQEGEDETFPKDQYYNPPEGEPLSIQVLRESADERVELREHPYTKIEVTLHGGSEVARELVALRLNPWWYPHAIYTPKDEGTGGPFTIGRVIHSSRGVGFTGWIGGVAIFDRALTENELQNLSALRSTHE